MKYQKGISFFCFYDKIKEDRGEFMDYKFDDQIKEVTEDSKKNMGKLPIIIVVVASVFCGLLVFQTQ